MNAKQIKLTNNYRSQAPRCYLCKNYKSGGSGVGFCTFIPTTEFRVRPNGICEAYTPGANAKETPND